MAAAKGKAKGKAAGASLAGYSLRTLKWRYTEWGNAVQGRELYDHDADPKELKNLAEVAAHAQTVAQLSQQLRAAVKSTYPVSGEVPSLSPGGMWNPMLVPP